MKIMRAMYPKGEEGRRTYEAMRKLRVPDSSTPEAREAARLLMMFARMIREADPEEWAKLLQAPARIREWACQNVEQAAQDVLDPEVNYLRGTVVEPDPNP